MTASDSTIKIHAFLATKGLASRRRAEEMVAAGRVTVNGVSAQIGQRVDPTKDIVALDGEPLSVTPEALKYFLVYKPVGYVSTTSDELGRKNVLQILPKVPGRLYPVGRLDVESEGLMLLTNDGDLAYKMTHPKFEIEKTYQVTLDRDISEAAFDHLYKGVKLKDGFAATKKLEFADQDKLNILNITVTEGRNRLVRRMLERVGYDIVKLVRTHMGPFSLEQLDGKQYLEVEAPSI
jgi:23S rRNA pseudouridine2605 synthase